jgi:acyl carrier protein
MATSSSDADVLDRFSAIVAESLRIPRERVTAEAYLNDLGAESLDLLEITMEAEDEFGILIPQKNILETAQVVFGPGVMVAEGKLTPAGARFLRSRMPEVPAEEIAPGMAVADLARAFQRVGTWVRMIRGLMEQSPRNCPTCATPFPKALAGRVKCTKCGAELDLPSGDDLNRRWVEEYRTSGEFDASPSPQPQRTGPTTTS